MIFKRVWQGSFVIAVLLGVWSVFIEPGLLRVKHHAIYLEQWPRELAGLKIAFLSDLHIGSPHISSEVLERIVDRTNTLKPDVILLGGDYVIQDVLGGQPVPSREIIEGLSRLHARYGVYAVLGNHDWWDNAPRMAEEFSEEGIPLLEDHAKRIDKAAAPFWVAGVSDYNEGPHDIDKALRGVNRKEPVIVFTHSPDIFPKLPSFVALTLAGHTHGGQVYVPFLGRPVIPSEYGQRYAKGLIEEDGKQLFVGTGIGTSILPIRFMTPPQIGLLSIYPRPTDRKQPQ